MIFILASLLIRLKLSDIIKEVDMAVTTYRPVEQQVQQLNDSFHDAAFSLAMFASLHDDVSIDRYSDALKMVHHHLDQLRNFDLVFQSPRYRELMSKIQDHAKKLGEYGESLLATRSEEINFPGYVFAKQKLNPISLKIEQKIADLIRSSTPHDNQEDYQLILLKSNLHYNWVNVMSSVWAYLTHRSDSNIQDNQHYLNAVNRTLEKIASYQDALESDELEILNDMKGLLSQFNQGWKELQAIHGGDGWRVDSFLMRRHISPLLYQLHTEVKELEQTQLTNIDKNFNQLLMDSKSITNLADLFMFLSVFTGIVLALIISRMISKPIYQIADAMENIAGGEADLTQRIDVSARDEVARLADSFNTFILKAQVRSEEEHALADLLRLSLMPTSLDTYLNDALRSVIDTVTWLAFEPKGGIFITDIKDTNRLILTANYNIISSHSDHCSSVSFGQCLCGRAAESREIIFADHQNDLHDTQCDQIIPHTHYCVPIQSEECLQGVLVLYLCAGHKQSANEEDFLRRIAEVLSMGIRLRQTNDELRIAKQQAESFSEQIANITANIPGIIYQCCKTGENEYTYPFVSSGTSMLLGKDKDRPESDIHHLFENVHEQDREHLEHVINHSAKHLEPINIEYRIHMDDGDVHWILCNALPSQTIDQYTLWDGILLDITDRKNLEMKLQQAQKLESVGQLAAGIAHEINTPTQYIQENVRFLQDAFNDYLKALTAYQKIEAYLIASPLAGEWLKQVETILQEIDLEYLNEEVPQAITQSLDGIQRIRTIVAAMKEFSHPGTDERKPMDINRVIETVSTVARNEWKYVADLELDLPDGLPSPIGYLDKIGQVILNLIVNAAHAIGDMIGAGKYDKGYIKVATYVRDGQFEIDVSDNGPGIPQNIINKVFDPFFTTKEVGKGTGQGLSIAHSVIVEQHGGNLSVESEPGKGTTFTIQLPLEPKKIS
ncbi:MAG: ATP-binding protein [Candidatus Thiodiazotropha sp.]